MINVQNVLYIKKQIRQHCFLSPHIQKKSLVKSAEKAIGLTLNILQDGKCARKQVLRVI